MHSIADSNQHIDRKKKNYEDDVKQVMQEQYVHSKLAINSGYFPPILQNSSNQHTCDEEDNMFWHSELLQQC